MILNQFITDVTDFLDPIKEFVQNVWMKISSFFLQYMSQSVFTLFCFIIVLFFVLIFILAIMNRK